MKSKGGLGPGRSAGVRGATSRPCCGSVPRTSSHASSAPHGLRHAAITDALDLSNGNLRAVQRISTSGSSKTLLCIGQLAFRLFAADMRFAAL